MPTNQAPFPPLLRQTNQLPYSYAEGDGIDYEPLDAFMSVEETAEWFHAWTGNPNADASKLKVFGQDGSGGYAALWLVRDTDELLKQPIVFLGSEGEITVVARDFYDYLWLLATGIGPCEATLLSEMPRMTQPELELHARRNAGAFRSVADVLRDAKTDFPGFEKFVESQCR